MTLHARLAVSLLIATLAPSQSHADAISDFYKGVTIHQDANVFAGRLSAGARLRQELHPGRHAWLQVALGSVTVNGRTLQRGDGLATTRQHPPKRP